MIELWKRALLPVASLLAAAACFAGYLPTLGTYELVLPAGAHYVTTPLARPESTDLPGGLGSSWQAIDAIASYDPGSRSWMTWYPNRRSPADGTRRAYGPVLRIHLSQPTAIAFRGTQPSAGWQAELSAAAGSSFLGPVSTTAVSLPEVVRVLESTGRFTLARDGLWRWDWATASWVAIDATRLSGQTLEPGTALFTNASAPLASGFTIPSGPGAQLSDPSRPVTTYVYPSLGGDDPNSYVFKLFIEGYTGLDAP